MNGGQGGGQKRRGWELVPGNTGLRGGGGGGAGAGPLVSAHQFREVGEEGLEVSSGEAVREPPQLTNILTQKIHTVIKAVALLALGKKRKIFILLSKFLRDLIGYHGAGAGGGDW